MKTSLTQKYNVPGTRYISYPTAHYWNETDFTTEKWTAAFQKAFLKVTHKRQEDHLFVICNTWLYPFENLVELSFYIVF